MYFAVIGDKKELTLKELETHCKNIEYFNSHIITFETDNISFLNKSGSIIKRGKVTPHQQLGEYFSNTKILGCNKKEFAIKMKKQFNIKRFKITNIIRTDRQVREKGSELIKIGNFYGIVLGYQNIPLYEKIDFEKPARSMKMGMMPSKIAHIMLNIGNNITTDKEKETIIYDPFVGSGTTNFLANYLGIESVGSDIKTQFFAENLDWRKEQEEFNQEKRIQIFSHDMYTNYSSENKVFFKEKIPIIVSEGWLGPIVNSTTNDKSIYKYQKQVADLYIAFLRNIHSFLGKVPMVFTIPYYLNLPNIKNTLDQKLKKLSEKLGREYSEISEIYARDNQQVGRKIIILK